MNPFRLQRPLRPLSDLTQTGSFQRVSQHISARSTPQGPQHPQTYQQDQMQLQQSPNRQPVLRTPVELFRSENATPIAQTSRTGSLPDYKSAGDEISVVASGFGYQRGDVIRDKQVIQAMLNKAGELYGIPGDFLYRTAQRESGARHWDRSGQVRSAAAVGMMQIEKSAYPKATAGGPAQARDNVYDLGNNMAMGARNLRKNLDRLARKTGYTGAQPWADLAPLLNISYNAGAGALRKAMDKAREMGLDPHNWQHLAFGRNVSIPAEGTFIAPPGSIESAPLHLALKEIHDGRAARGVHNYPIYWHNKANVNRHDFDQNGVATRAERLISRIVYTQTGNTLRAR